ncbi:type II toxin-antitoxin system VapB family antitoxin [Pseudonocardia spinosispora]|uniref:type II toxin-antitoxin system VapB family antitoxin n=1 Tax=Pseudonocardia spinosispora TaxID=103441 RepID=UPI0004043AB0|nr:type II toxin-antitoxin system VapB family antitoxin [Pseudonocardia spinosispora]
MALSIKDPEADRLARELAARTGESLTEVVIVALRERLARQQGRTRAVPLRDDLAAIRARCSTLPRLDDRSPDEILGYDDHGLPA